MDYQILSGTRKRGKQKYPLQLRLLLRNGSSIPGEDLPNLDPIVVTILVGAHCVTAEIKADVGPCRYQVAWQGIGKLFTRSWQIFQRS